MVALISLVEAKEHLRRTDTAADPDIQRKIYQASAIVMTHCKLSELREEWILNHSPITQEIPWDIKAATFLILGELFANRDSASNIDAILNNGLLSAYRDPTLA